jgi:hypothetical protein
MIIDSSQVSYVTAHRSESATAVIDQTLVRARPSRARAAPLAADTVQLSSPGDREDLQDLNPRQRLAVLAIEAILGHRISLARFQRPSAAPAASAANAAAAQVRRTTEMHSESEQTSFQAQGVVNTTDGRSIRFAASFSMQREFQSLSVTTGPSRTADPLVVNFGGAPAQLTGAKISFDLNSDGSPESIAFVAGGSGFLVLDANHDGKANDGRELFGPQTGSGFGELAAYDTDGNGWIDEGDPVFADLRIWTQSGLSSLSEKGIGAIATSSAETPFAIKDSANSLQGNVRASGIYLTETGTAGTVQQVDLAV